MLSLDLSMDGYWVELSIEAGFEMRGRQGFKPSGSDLSLKAEI